MATIPDREDRAAAAKRVAVRRRKRPLPAPDMLATILVPHTKLPTKPKPGQRSVVFKPQPQPRHLPTPIEKQSMLDVMLPPKPGSTRAKQITRYNQDAERQRRREAAAVRAAEAARRKQVRALNKTAREFLGRDKLDEFIKTGAIGDSPGLFDYIKAVGAASVKAAEYLPKKAAEAVIGAAYTGQQRGALQGTAQLVDDTGKPLVEGLGDVVLGPNVIKAARGEDYNRGWLIAELALLPIPMRGLPTPITAALRAAVGAQRLARAEKAGLTVAEAIETLTKPISEVKAARRMALVERAAEANAAGAVGPIASSTPARIGAAAIEKVVPGRVGRAAARVVRNDVRAQRQMKFGETFVPIASDLSRTGKGLRAIMDRARDSRLVPLRSQETLAARQLGKRAAQHMNRAAGLEHKLAAAVPRGALRRVDYPQMYAARAILKGSTIEELIAKTEKNIQIAVERNDWVGAQANKIHLAEFQAAAKYVTTDAAGNPVLREDAPKTIRDLVDAVSEVSGRRESILKGLDRLSAERAEGRILNEQLYYAEAARMPTDDDVARRIAANPMREQVADLWTKQNPEYAPYALTIMDAKARGAYQAALDAVDAQIAEAEGWLARNPDGPLAARHKATIAKLKAERDSLDPGDLYSTIREVSNRLPDDVIAEISKTRGVLGRDWQFSLVGKDDEVKAAAKRITDEIVASDIALPPEWSDPEKIQAGIEEVFRLAREGEYGKDWYPEAAEGVMRVAKATRTDPKVVAQLFAIYSQAADTIANSTFVFKAIRQFQKHKDLFVGRFPTRQSEEALNVLRGGTWEGRKRSSFYANILRHMPGYEDEYARVIAEMAAARGAPINHPVTVDRWVVRMFNALGKTKAGKDKDVPGKFYDAFETVIQRMAESIGWEPEQLQAAAWVTKKAEGIEREIAAAGGKVTGPLKARYDAGAGDAFQAGIERGLAKLDEPISDVPPQAERLANQVNKRWGGFTVDRDLKPVPEEGYSVSYSLTDTPFPLHKVKGADIVEFRDRYAVLLKDSRNKIGGFSDDANDFGDGTEITSLSINRHFKRKADALRFAREQGQETVYEYKTGDGIRTGLTRDEQRAVIEGLDDAHLKGAPRSNYLPPSEHEMEMKKFFDEAARELGIAKKKVVTAPQRAKAEEWLSRHAEEFPDEDLVQRYWELSRGTPEDDLPAWALEPKTPEAQKIIDRAPSRLRESLFDDVGDALEGADSVLSEDGARIAREFDAPGFEQAMRDLEAGILPRDFIEAVANGPLHIYDKLAVGQTLNVASGDALRNFDWDTDAVKRMFPKALSLAGLWDGESRRLWFSDGAHPIDWIHEFTHVLETNGHIPAGVKDDLWRHLGAKPGAKLTKDQSEDLADLVTSRVLGFDPKDSDLPQEVQDALVAIRDSVRETEAAGGRVFHRENEALAAMPEGERNFLEDILGFFAENERQFTNGFKPRPGVYTPEKLALPFRFGNPLAPRRTSTLWYRMLAGKRITNLTETDKHLSKEFKAVLLESGRWSKDVTEGPLEGLLKAYQIERMHDLRDVMIRAGKAVPDSEHDIMIPLDPAKWTDETRAKARNMIEILNTMDTGATIDKMELTKVDAEAIDAIKDYLFPGLADGGSEVVRDIARQAIRDGGIDGVVWVNRTMLERTGLFGRPLAPGSRALKYGLDAADTVNNVMKMLTLSLNPAYYPMNMAGQAVMSFAQLGFSTPFAVARSLKMMRALTDDEMAIIDRFSGVGFSGAQVLSKGGAFAKTTDTVGKVGTILIDQTPRRIAFLHEARRLGYDTPEKVRALINDIDNFDDLVKVHDRVGRAMVDYGNLNRFEKELLTRLVFVYPWLRGSSRYAAQFPFDHPIQAAIFAGLIYWQQNRLREALPDRPGYLKWYVPLHDTPEGENPYGFRMDQLFTPLQTLDLAAMMTDWATGGRQLPWGSNEEAMGSMLSPLVEEITKTITGFDPFTRQEVDRGLPDFFLRIFNPKDRYASWKRIEKLAKGETHKGLYDTTKTQNWLRLFLGSLAPINLDREKAAEMGVAQRGTPSAKQNRDDYVAKVEEMNGAPLTDAQRETIASWKEHDQTYRKVSREYRREHDIEGESTIQQRAAMMLLTLAEVNPDVADRAKEKADAVIGVDDETAQEAYDALRDALGLKKLSTLDGRIQKRLKEQNKAKQEES